MNQTLIVYGNCQAQNVAEVLKRNPLLAMQYRVLYLSSVTGLLSNEVSEADVAACGILLEQMNDIPFAYRDKLAPAAKTLVFRTAMLYFLYPFFSSANPYNLKRPPASPWGLFPYGDQAIIDLIDQGLPAAEILDIYLNHYERYAVDLEKLYRLERARQLTVDDRCDVKMAEFLLDNFRTQRLFFTITHPTPLVFRELLAQLVAACAAHDPALATVDIGATLSGILQTHPRGPLYTQVTPIHPKVAEHFALTWYDPNERFEVHTSLLSYRDYFAAMIAEFQAVKAAQERGQVTLG
ncbi:MAG: WcbI family polysaccharide biosynthesis putative acetyltransferase [Candidatus Velthaea sp.]|jgi:hypothetical protein